MTHTQTAKRGWWETPVAVRLHWCQRWANRGQLLTRQIYECYSSSVRVCVWVFLLGLPLAKPSLLHLHFLRTPSLSLSLSLWKDWWAAWLASILPDFLTEQREKRKNEESGVCRPSFIPLHLGSVKKTGILAVTNRAIKLYGPAEHATLLMMWEAIQKWHHLHEDLHTWWLTTMTSLWQKLPLATIKYWLLTMIIQ